MPRESLLSRRLLDGGVGIGLGGTAHELPYPTMDQPAYKEPVNSPDVGLYSRVRVLENVQICVVIYSQSYVNIRQHDTH